MHHGININVLKTGEKNKKIMIERINELAKIAKTRQLTKEEEKERKELREQYIKNFKNRFQNELNNVYIKNEDGTITKLEKKNDN